MTSFYSTIQIQATGKRVWDILTDVAAWPTWNTTIERVSGSVDLGSAITVYTKVSPGRAFPLKVTELTPPQRMVWRGADATGALYRDENLHSDRTARWCRYV